MAHVGPGSASTERRDAMPSTGWLAPLARLLGRSSRFASEEANHLVAVMRDMIAGDSRVAQPKRDVHAGPSVAELVEELVELVGTNDCASLQTDRKFWYLVRELYVRRPWVPRRPRDLVDTTGVEMTERVAPDDSAVAPDYAERTAT